MSERLKYDVWIEFDGGEATIYYSRRRAQFVEQLFQSEEVIMPPQEYCHKCFQIPCVCLRDET